MSDFSQEKYEEFVQLYKDPADGHKALMGMGQQMLTNSDLARRLRVSFKSAGGEGEGAAGAGTESDIDMEFFLTAMHDEIQRDPGLAGRLGLSVTKAADSDADLDDDDDPEFDEFEDDWGDEDGSVGDDEEVEEGDEEEELEPATVSSFKAKAAALIDEVFGRKSSVDDEYDDHDEDSSYDDDELTLSASDVGDGIGIEDRVGRYEGTSEKSAGIDDGLIALVSREAAKAAGGAAARAVSKQMGSDMEKLTMAVGALLDRVEKVEAANQSHGELTAQQMTAVKQAVDGLRDQYQLLDETLPPLANFDRLRVDKSYDDGWGSKDSDGGDGEYDEYEDAFDGAFIDPLVESTFGFTNSW